MSASKSKKQVANHLETIGQLKQISGANAFSFNAYFKAAKLISDITGDLTEEKIKAECTGVKTTKAALQFFESGSSDTFDKLSKTLPVECLSMTVVQGIGAKKAFKIHNLGFAKNFKELVNLAEKDDLQKLEQAKIGLKAETLKKAIIFARDTAAGRVPYSTAKYIADRVKEAVGHLAIKSEVAGSLRRKKETIKDIDLLLCVQDHATFDFNDCLKAMQDADIECDINNQGDVKASYRVKFINTQMMCDIWLVKPCEWGSFLNYATGSKEHNVKLRGLAQKKGLLVNERGIFKGDQRIGGEDEHDLYKILDIDYIEPESR